MKIFFSILVSLTICSPVLAVIDLTQISAQKNERDPAERNASYLKTIYPEKNCVWSPHPISKAHIYQVIENVNCEKGAPQKMIHGSVTCVGAIGEVTYPNVFCYDQTNAFECLTQGKLYFNQQFIPRTLSTPHKKTNRGLGD